MENTGTELTVFEESHIHLDSFHYSEFGRYIPIWKYNEQSKTTLWEGKNIYFSIDARTTNIALVEATAAAAVAAAIAVWYQQLIAF